MLPNRPQKKKASCPLVPPVICAALPPTLTLLPVSTTGETFRKLKTVSGRTGFTGGGLEDGVVALAPLTDKIPADVKALVAEKENAKEKTF